MFWFIVFYLFSINKCQDLLELDEGGICRHELENYDDYLGMCTHSRNCTHVNLILDRPHVCSFGLDHEPIICCPPLPIRPFEKYCEIYHRNSVCKPQLSSKYPIKSNRKKRCLDDVPMQHKHMAILGYNSNNLTKWNCSGALISKKHILTSAQCLQNGNPDYARLGVSDSSTDLARMIQDKEILLCTSHPDYDNTYNDIAVCELETDVQFTDYVYPACLNSNFKINFQHATVYQRTKKNSDDIVIKEEDILLNNGPKCRQVFDDIQKINATTQICVGELQKEVVPCVSDPGAPLVIDSSKICLKTIIGVTSVDKNSCISPHSPGIYTRVSHYLEWIEGHVWPPFEDDE